MTKPVVPSGYGDPGTGGAKNDDAGRHAAPWDVWQASRVRPADVIDLIRLADEHELGRDFLQKGAQDAVAATFGVHAFLVDAAREHLAE